MQIEHELKCHPNYFARLISGQKRFEVRKNDRNYQVGDRLVIKEYDPEVGWPDHGHNDTALFDIIYIGRDFIVPDFVVLGLSDMIEELG